VVAKIYKLPELQAVSLLRDGSPTSVEYLLCQAAKGTFPIYIRLPGGERGKLEGFFILDVLKDGEVLPLECDRQDAFVQIGDRRTLREVKMSVAAGDKLENINSRKITQILIDHRYPRFDGGPSTDTPPFPIRADYGHVMTGDAEIDSKNTGEGQPCNWWVFEDDLQKLGVVVQEPTNGKRKAPVDKSYGRLLCKLIAGACWVYAEDHATNADQELMSPDRPNATAFAAEIPVWLAMKASGLPRREIQPEGAKKDKESFKNAVNEGVKALEGRGDTEPGRGSAVRRETLEKALAILAVKLAGPAGGDRSAALEQSDRILASMNKRRAKVDIKLKDIKRAITRGLEHI
jgi:hypothetical protein